MFRFSFTLVSRNRKTGPIPVVRTSKNSCPDSCVLKNNGCYAEIGPTNMWWSKLNHKGLNEQELIESLYTIPIRSIWRMNEAGDLPHKNGNIDGNFLSQVVLANSARKASGFAYTHHDMSIEWNRYCVKKANDCGFTINLSCESVEDAIEKQKIAPVVVIVTEEFWQNSRNIRKIGNSFVVRCPAEYNENMNCAQCRICANNRRKSIVGFTAHGVNKRKVINIINQK